MAETQHVTGHRIHVLTLEGKQGKQMTLPHFFSVPHRPDLIRRAVVAAQANRQQPYGADPLAGTRRSVVWPGKGRGMARTPRVKNTNRGGFVPNTVGGREAHPPRAVTDRTKRINVKERQRALASALAATREVRFALERGHVLPEHLKLPLVFDDELEEVMTSWKAKEVLTAVGLWGDVERAISGSHLRAGKGKGRGRPRRVPRSLLVVVSTPSSARGFKNFKGVDVVPVHSLGTEQLAPGGDAGRLTLFTPKSLKMLEDRLGAHLLPTSLPAVVGISGGKKA
ncbi:MAG: 50S ribosomal protein L4 [Candidatus Thermoplasmatota archaeon]|jgi:large subunit ribosomal protein L4e|nr:50S ribosomal protein L4 [Candidatus Thermoplasmatota archaeon]